MLQEIARLFAIFVFLNSIAVQSFLQTAIIYFFL